MQQSQRGLSLVGFIFVLVAGGALAMIAIRAVPAHTEYFSIVRILKEVAKEVGSNGTKSQVATAFDRRAQIDDITAVRGSDVRVSREGGKTVLSVEYEKRQTLFRHMSILFDFNVSSTSD